MSKDTADLSEQLAGG